MIKPQQKHTKQHHKLINNIQSNQKITTINNIKNTIKTINKTTIIITINNHNTKLTFKKPTIKQINPS